MAKDGAANCTEGCFKLWDFFSACRLAVDASMTCFSTVVAFARTWGVTPWTKREACVLGYVTVPIDLSPGSELVEVRSFTFGCCRLAWVKGYGGLDNHLLCFGCWWSCCSGIEQVASASFCTSKWVALTLGWLVDRLLGYGRVCHLGSDRFGG